MRKFSVTELRDFRARAKAIRREGKMIHCHALDSIAQEEGFKDWQSLIHVARANPFEPDPLHFGALDVRREPMRPIKGWLPRSPLRQGPTSGRSSKSKIDSEPMNADPKFEIRNFELGECVTGTEEPSAEPVVSRGNPAAPIIVVRKRVTSAEQAHYFPKVNPSPAPHSPRRQLTLKAQQPTPGRRSSLGVVEGDHP